MERWLDAETVAVAVGRSPVTIRRWASKGWLARKGTGRHGKALYDVGEAEKLAQHLASLDNRTDVGEHLDDSQESAQPAEPG